MEMVNVPGWTHIRIRFRRAGRLKRTRGRTGNRRSVAVSIEVLIRWYFCGRVRGLTRLGFGEEARAAGELGMQETKRS